MSSDPALLPLLVVIGGRGVVTTGAYVCAMVLGAMTTSLPTAHAGGPSSLSPDIGNGTAIIGGEKTEPGEFVNVVAVVAGTGLCTGTLVAENLVITAAHCLANLPADTPIAVYFGGEIDPDQVVGATSFGAHPQFCATCDEDIYDYGYVVTSVSFNPPYAQLIGTQRAWDETMAVGAEVTLVGFGSDPNAEDDESIGVKRKVTTTITRFSKDGLEFFAGGDERDSCEGDSGGPAFVTLADGSVLLAGITSRGSSPCGKGGFYGAPYPSLCWIREETGIDLLNGDCSACDCIDTAPPDDGDDSGCSIAAVAAPHERGGAGWALTLIVLGIAGQRRRRH
ncbi:MAG: trypsin-like serine protease [Nannocystaceae bacterium]|nr:trypsin-like serine protease [Nannocystaceae bacterium]